MRTQEPLAAGVDYDFDKAMALVLKEVIAKLE